MPEAEISDEIRRLTALDRSLEASKFMGGSDAKSVVEGAKIFEAYLKGETSK